MKRLLTLIFLLNAPATFGQLAAFWTKPANAGALAGTQFLGATRKDDIHFWRKDVGIAVSASGRIIKTLNGGASWSVKYVSNLPLYEAYLRSIEASDGGAALIAGSVDGIALRSTDSGETWQDITSAISDTGVDARNICGLAHHGDTFYGVGWYGARRARFYKSTDAGQTWQTKYLDTALATGLVEIQHMRGKLFASGCRDFATNRRESVVLRSSDDGATWTKVFADTNIGGRIWKLQFLDNTHAYGAVEPIFGAIDTVNIIRSSDDGATWTMQAVGKGPGNFRVQGVGFVDSLRGFVGGHGAGMFATANGGQSWQFLPIGRNFNRFYKMDPGLLYAMGDSLHVFSDSAASAAGVAPAYFATPSAHKLYPPAPNPANSQIRFGASLAFPTNVVIEIIDLTGRRVYPITNGRYAAGSQSFAWDCSQKSPGTYLVTMETHDSYQTQIFTVRH